MGEELLAVARKAVEKAPNPELPRERLEHL
jgi:hypothetical protein